MKKILVTGINGLIGQYTIEPLKELGFEVYGIGTKNITTNKFQYIQLDINNSIEIENIFSRIKPEYLIHLAWDINDLNSNYHFNLLVSSINMIDYFYKNGGRRAVYIGSCFEYKFKELPLKELDELNLTTTYSKCKNYLREISEFYCLKNNIDFCWARVFYVYGKNENPKRIFPYIINNLKENKKVIINHSQLKKDYMFAGDVAKAIALITNSDFSGIVNICSGKSISLKEFALIIAKKMNKEYLLEFKELNTDEPNIIIGDNSKLINEIGFNDYSNMEDVFDNLISEYCK
ncbi:NAD-dependent epimerase/dehydratase family protein [uncultured Brachyspira sp.]|uniref:NAD-dependent epimerase/dehydratase family protein n=1 Tax=uncultured Brachyspira sp. TaxID=221953 RepID=UPI002590122B|nr:NAD-dependent epimerase/dehydratase family protein [uncultured Brachyspira sp.]